MTNVGTLSPFWGS